MPVVLIHQGPTVTAENYRATVQKLAGKDKLESVSDWPVGGPPFPRSRRKPERIPRRRRLGVPGRVRRVRPAPGTDPRRGRHHGSAGDVPGGDLRFELVPQLRQEQRVVRVLLLAVAEVAVDPRARDARPAAAKGGSVEPRAELLVEVAGPDNRCVNPSESSAFA